MELQEIKNKLRGTFKQVLNLSDSELEQELELVRKDIHAWDSLGHVSLVTALEKEFDVVFEIEEIEPLDSFAVILAALQDKIG